MAGVGNSNERRVRSKLIIVRSPLRISLGGGGTDLASYYRKYEGFVVSAAIDKYVYIILHDAFLGEILIKYSKLEKTESIEDIQHPIIRETAKYLGSPVKNFELASMADIPSGTGLGSSSSFTCALLKAFHTYNQTFISPVDLAKEACHIEIDILKEPIGKQDQYISALGGINKFTFCKNDDVTSEKLSISKDTLYDMEDNMLLFFTGFTRSASGILNTQDVKSKENDTEMINNLHVIKDIGYSSKKLLEEGNLDYYAELMNNHWEHKKKRSPDMSNSHINKWYSVGMASGALGGKLIGAGGGGFLMFYTHKQKQLRKAMAKEALREVRFKFDFEGTKVITS
jgi:D-glycero-alpha-D-manno-heptose-7-phosphate kinase